MRSASIRRSRARSALPARWSELDIVCIAAPAMNAKIATATMISRSVKPRSRRISEVLGLADLLRLEVALVIRDEPGQSRHLDAHALVLGERLVVQERDEARGVHLAVAVERDDRGAAAVDVGRAERDLHDA